MGYGNDNLLDEDAEARLRELLTHTHATDPLTPPADLLQRVRIPATPPQRLQHQARSRTRQRWVVGGALVTAWVVLAATGVQFTLSNMGDDVALLLAQTAGTLMPNRTAAQELSPIVLGGAGMLLMLLLSVGLLICLRAWPYRTTAAALTLIRHPIQAILPGLVSSLALLPLALLLAGALAATLVGLPLAIAILVAVAILVVYALAALARAFALSLGEPLQPVEGLHTTSMLVGLGCALLLGLLAAFMPMTALILGGILCIPGLGAIIASRGGTLIEW